MTLQRYNKKPNYANKIPSKSKKEIGLAEDEAEGGEELDEEDGYDDEGSAFCDA